MRVPKEASNGPLIRRCLLLPPALALALLTACPGGSSSSTEPVARPSAPPAAVLGGLAGAVQSWRRTPAAVVRTEVVTGTRAELLALVRRAQSDGVEKRYLVPSEAEADAYRELIEAVVRRAPGGATELDDLQGTANAIGMEIVRYLVPPEAFVVVREMSDLQRGAGCVLVRAGEGAGATVVMAPHSFADPLTAEIAFDLFWEGRARALQVNTIRRDAELANPAEAGGMERPADVAVAPVSLYQSAAEGIAGALARASFLQLHGFAREEHPEVPAPMVAIASRGNAYLSRDDALERFVAALRERLGEQAVGRFGQEVRLLGGTENAQGRFLNSYSDDRFYHLELEQALQRRLLADDALRAALAAAVRGLREGA